MVQKANYGCEAIRADHKSPINWPDDLIPLFADNRSETTSRLVGPGPHWAIEPRYIIIIIQ